MTNSTVDPRYVMTDRFGDTVSVSLYPTSALITMESEHAQLEPDQLVVFAEYVLVTYRPNGPA